MIQLPTTLTCHILKEPSLESEVMGELCQIMAQIALAGKMIARELSHAGLSDVRGATGETNVQGEEVQKLDDQANTIFVSVFDGSEVVRTVVSEEMEKPHVVQHAQRPGRYAIYLDPLDGSSNIDVNAPLGSIFSIHRIPSSSSGESESDLLKPGRDQVGAGYLLYGTSTELIYTCGNGVHQFTLDPEIGDFFLTTEKVTMPSCGKIYSTNEGNYQKWATGTQRYIDSVKETDASTNRPYGGRYSGCFVADVHRVLLKGGIYLYPGEVEKPEGKLRLMYEAAPLTFVIEQAGGLGSTGGGSIQAIQPDALHQRVPVFIGSRENVKQAQQFVRG